MCICLHILSTICLAILSNLYSANLLPERWFTIAIAFTQSRCHQVNLGVSKNNATPKWMVKIMENPMNKWMIWGVLPPVFLVQHPFPNDRRTKKFRCQIKLCTHKSRPVAIVGLYTCLKLTAKAPENRPSQ